MSSLLTIYMHCFFKVLLLIFFTCSLIPFLRGKMQTLRLSPTKHDTNFIQINHLFNVSHLITDILCYLFSYELFLAEFVVILDLLKNN